MITFKAFLEAEVKPFSAEKMEVNAELLTFIRRHCSKSIWMFDNLTPIWRGERQAAALLGSDGVAVIDTTQSERSSQNTRNWYTLILDNHPAYKEFPKRSQSIICTTKYSTAQSYGRDNAMAVIPFDSAKIGWVNAPDIWKKSVNLGDNRESLIGMNDFFNSLESLGLKDDDWQSFVEFDKNLKTDEGMRRIVGDELISIGIDSHSVEEWMDNFLNKIREAYADLNMEIHTPASIRQYEDMFTSKESLKTKASEMWIGGKVLCLDEDVFEELAEAGI